VDELAVNVRGARTRLGTLLAYERDRAAALHARDRVGTYGSFHIARLQA
jgi:hypothetical protein